METTVWAYQITPGHDDLLFFAETEEACRSAALEQRAELKQPRRLCGYACDGTLPLRLPPDDR